VHRPSSKGTKLLLQAIIAIIHQNSTIRKRRQLHPRTWQLNEKGKRRRGGGGRKQRVRVFQSTFMDQMRDTHRDIKRDCFDYIIVQTYDVVLHVRRHPMEFDAGTWPFASFDAPSS